MQPNYSFTTMQCIHAIANWKLQPFTLPELNYLLKFFAPDSDNASYEYGQNDIESFILETLSDMELPDSSILRQLTAIKTETLTEQEILTNLLTVPDPSGDDLLSHIECTYYADEPGYPIQNPNAKLKYQDGIDFLIKYNLMP